MHTFLQLHACGFVYPFEHIALYAGRHLKRKEKGNSFDLGISISVGTRGARLIQKIQLSNNKGAKDLQNNHQKVNASHFQK